MCPLGKGEKMKGKWLDFASRREADDAAALAFAKLSTELRAELLAGRD